MVDHGDILLSFFLEMYRVSDAWRSHTRSTIRVACIDLTLAILNLGHDIIGKISPKSSSGHEVIPLLDFTLFANMGFLMS